MEPTLQANEVIVDETPELSILEIVEDLVGQVDKEWTPYMVATLANSVFEAVEFDKKIPTQMMYTYDNNGMIVKGTKKARRFTGAQVTEFMVAYITRTINK